MSDLFLFLASEVSDQKVKRGLLDIHRLDVVARSRGNFDGFGRAFDVKT